MFCEIAPAKINLALEITGKRKDGYHELISVMQTIDICDVLTFWENEWIQVIPEYQNLPSCDTLARFDCNNYFGNNLVYRAAELLKNETGCRSGAAIQLKKNIPSSAGLGGGSSDAAAALKGLNKLWKLGLSKSELAEIGSKLGSDVAFFIYGGTCLAQGRGEKVVPLEPIDSKWVLVTLIPLSIKAKTSTLYSYVKPQYYSDGLVTRKLIDWIGRNKKGCPPEECLINTFEMVYFNGYPEFRQWKKFFRLLEKSNFHIAGSGPAVYSISDSSDDLKSLISSCLDNDMFPKYLARTVPERHAGPV